MVWNRIGKQKQRLEFEMTGHDIKANGERNGIMLARIVQRKCKCICICVYLHWPVVCHKLCANVVCMGVFLLFYTDIIYIDSDNIECTHTQTHHRIHDSEMASQIVFLFNLITYDIITLKRYLMEFVHCIVNQFVFSHQLKWASSIEHLSMHQTLARNVVYTVCVVPLYK